MSKRWIDYSSHISSVSMIIAMAITLLFSSIFVAEAVDCELASPEPPIFISPHDGTQKPVTVNIPVESHAAFEIYSHDFDSGIYMDIGEVLTGEIVGGVEGDIITHNLFLESYGAVQGWQFDYCSTDPLMQLGSFYVDIRVDEDPDYRNYWCPEETDDEARVAHTIINVKPWDVYLKELYDCLNILVAGGCFTGDCSPLIPKASIRTLSVQDPGQFRWPSIYYKEVIKEGDCITQGGYEYLRILVRDRRGKVWKTGIDKSIFESVETEYPLIHMWEIGDYAILRRRQENAEGNIRYWLIYKSGIRSNFKKLDYLPRPAIWEQTTTVESVQNANGEYDAILSYNGDGTLASFSMGDNGLLQYEYIYDGYGNLIGVKVIAPNGSYIFFSFITSGNGTGKPGSIAYYDSSETLISETTYSYDASGRVTLVQQGSRQVEYVYNNDDQTLIVTELSAAPMVQTIYHYGWSGQTGEDQPGSDETWVIMKHASNYNTAYESGDRKIIYSFYMEGDSKTDVNTVTDPDGNTTTYTVYNDKLYSIVDPTNLNIGMTYDTASGALKEISYSNPSVGGLGTESMSYYNDAMDNVTTWAKTFTDVRGNYVHFDRNNMLDQPWCVNSIKVHEPVAPWGNPPTTEPNWSTVDPVVTYEYYGTIEDITSAATLTYDYSYNPPTWRPENLRDGYVGVGYEDWGQWDYNEGEYIAYTYANASYWTWAEEKTLTSINLYVDPDIDPYVTGADIPNKIKIFAKDDVGDYNVLVYATEAFPPEFGETWISESWNGQDVDAIHIKTNIKTTGLKISYGHCDGPCHLGEVRIHASDGGTADGKPGQLKKVIVPNIEGNDAYEVEFKYGESGKIRDFPTQILYPYWNAGTQQYDIKTETISYNDMGQVLSTIDANNRIIQFEYDAIGRPTKAIFGTGIESEMHYGCCGVEWAADEEDRTVNVGYDLANRLSKAWISNTGQSTNSPLIDATYDVFGSIASDRTYSDSSTSKEMSYGYDNNNRLTSIEYPDDLIGEEQAGYDSVGNLLWYRKDNKDLTWTTTLYRYDELHRLDAIYYNYQGSLNPPSYEGLTPDVTIAYEGYSGLVSEITDDTGTSYFYYDILGQLVRYTPSDHDQVDYMIAYTYNNLGEKTSITIGRPDPNDPNYPEYEKCALIDITYDVEYTYYKNGLLRRVFTNGGNDLLAEYTYNATDVRVDYGNGTYTTYTYDSDPRYFLTDISHYKEGTPDTLLMSFDYTTRDKTGNPEGITDSVGNWSYTYGADGRLTGATPPDGPIPDQPAGGVYGYDWVGNRENPPTDPNQLVYNTADQLTLWPGMYSYTYFPDGSLNEVRNAQGVLVASYTYNDAGLLDTAAYPTGEMTNTWDALGNRIGITVGVDEYSFVYDITAGVPAPIEEVTPGGTVKYFRTPGGVLIARVKGADWRYYHYDEIGSTRMLTDNSGNVTDTYTYDAYGSVISHNGITTDNPYQYVGALGYYTHWQCPEVKLLQLGFRFYDPEIGRFTQLDPIGSGLNWYEYCGGSPFAWIDPWGLDWWNPIDWGKDIWNGAQSAYDYWQSGELGSHIPILGGWAEQAGHDWGMAESGRGSWGQAAWSTGKAAVGTAAAGVGIYYGGAYLIRAGSRFLSQQGANAVAASRLGLGAEAAYWAKWFFPLAALIGLHDYLDNQMPGYYWAVDHLEKGQYIDTPTRHPLIRIRYYKNDKGEVNAFPIIGPCMEYGPLI